MQGWLGIVALVGFAWLLSENRWDVRLRPVFVGLLLQFALAAALLRLPVCKTVFLALNNVILAIDRATTAGTSLVFGFLGGGALPFAEPTPGSAFILAFRALPLVLVVSALSSLLFYWRILPLVVRGFSWLLRRTLQVGGAVGVGAAANIFVGMIEAPLLVRPYLRQMSRSELFVLMTCGMSTIAGTVLVLYSTLLQGIIPDPLGHILTASIISAPAAILIAQLMIPPDEQRTEGEAAAFAGAGNAIDAVTQGTLEGLKLLLNIVAMLHRPGGAGASGQPAARVSAGFCRATAQPAAHARLAHGAGRLADRHPLAGSGHGRQSARDENDPQRTDRLSRYGQAAGRGARRTQPADHDLCFVRFCQFRQPGDHDRRARRHGAGAP